MQAAGLHIFLVSFESVTILHLPCAPTSVMRRPKAQGPRNGSRGPRNEAQGPRYETQGPRPKSQSTSSEARGPMPDLQGTIFRRIGQRPSSRFCRPFDLNRLVLVLGLTLQAHSLTFEAFSGDFQGYSMVILTPYFPGIYSLGTIFGMKPHRKRKIVTKHTFTCTKSYDIPGKIP
jgi:hypothetical protein